MVVVPRGAAAAVAAAAVAAAAVPAAVVRSPLFTLACTHSPMLTRLRSLAYAHSPTPSRTRSRLPVLVIYVFYTY
jgi:hypothetical protein